jgi:hypothetical protein
MPFLAAARCFITVVALLSASLLALLASDIYWQRRHRALAIVDKTAEETHHE